MKWRTKPALTRQAWLKELGQRLVWYFPAAQVKDILSDYQEQFDAGQEHGRTEAEIIQALGTPAEAAALLLEEEPSAQIGLLRHVLLWGTALAVCGGGLWLGLVRSIHEASFLVFLFLPLTVSALFPLLRGPARVTLEDRFSPERTVSPVGAYCVPAALIVVYEGVEQLLLVLGRAGLLPDHIGPFVMAEINTYFLIAVELVLIALLLWLLVRSLTVSIRYFPGVIHTFGAGSSLFFTYTFFISYHIGTSSSVSIDLLLALLPYCTGLATALVFQRWTDGRRPLPRFFRDGEAAWEDWRHRLGVGLLGWYDAAQAIEVLEDYQEQYDLGREQGKNEEALLSEMGRPETVVRDLLKEDRKARLRPRKTWVWAVLAGISGWMLLGLLGTFEFGGMFNWFMNYPVRAGVLAVVLGTASLYELLHVRSRVVLEGRFPADKQPTVWVYLLPLLLAAVTVGLVWYCTSRSWTSLKPYVYFVCWVEGAILLLTALLIWTLARSSSASIRYFPAAIHAAGCAASLLCAGISLHSIDFSDASPDPARPLWCLPCLLPYGLGALLALATRLSFRFLGKKEG